MDIFSIIIIAYFLMIILGWIYVFYHKIKCRNVKKCPNEKCTYRATCKHTAREYQLKKRMEFVEMRLAQLEKQKEKEKEKEEKNNV